MTTKTLAVKLSLAALAVAGPLLCPTTAHADEREQCATAADQAQQLRDDGKYRRAREQFLLCARDVCPGPIKKDCLDWLAKVDEVAPTVVFSAKAGDNDVSDVTVFIDGVEIAEKLDGKPLLVDTGVHTFRFDHAGESKEQKILVTAGQKGRNISVDFAATAPKTPPPPAAEQPSRGAGSLVPAIVVGSVGVIGIGSFAVFGLSGTSAVSDLDKCKPNCPQSDVDKARTKLLIADISLGVGVVALGVATYLFLTRPHLEDHVTVTNGSRAPREPVKGLSNVSVDVAPVAGGGAAASFGASF
jgi:hypothetical protein